VWLYSLAAVALWAPAALADWLIEGGVTWAGAGFMAGSGLLHVGYYASLQRAYATGDLSVVYPLARGSGPVLSVAAAILLLGERPSPLGLAGGALIIAAVLALVAGGSRAGTGQALTTGAFIAAYTVWDAHAVGPLHQPPVVYFWGAEAMRAILGAPFARGAAAVWRENRRAVLGVGTLSPLAYILVLVALTLAPVAIVAPGREASIVIASLLGAKLLGEGDPGRRATAAVAILAGIACLAAG
jgi:drug/metabolite transporter (DMT)-like permease